MFTYSEERLIVCRSVILITCKQYKHKKCTYIRKYMYSFCCEKNHEINNHEWISKIRCMISNSFIFYLLLFYLIKLFLILSYVVSLHATTSNQIKSNQIKSNQMYHVIVKRIRNKNNIDVNMNNYNNGKIHINISIRVNIIFRFS